MIRKQFTVCIALAAALLGGCAQMNNLKEMMDERIAATNRTIYAQQSDRTIAEAFYKLEQGGRVEQLDSGLVKGGYALRHTGVDGLHFKRRMITQEANWDFARGKMNNYSRSLLDDPVVIKYLDVTRGRGNVVRLYKPAMGSTINSNFKQYHFLDHDKNTQEWYGLDNALIEYGREGQIVSFLAKSYQGIATIGVSIDEYVHIYYGANAGHHLENSVDNASFTQTFLRDLPAAAPKAAAAPAEVAPVAAIRAPVAAQKATTVALTASSKCGQNEDLVRYTGFRTVQGAIRIDAVVLKSGRKTFSNYPVDVFKAQAPKLGQFMCWDNQG